MRSVSVGISDAVTLKALSRSTKNTQPVLVIGVVKWVRRLANSGQYRIGMNYDEVSSGSQRRLDRYFK